MVKTELEKYQWENLKELVALAELGVVPAQAIPLVIALLNEHHAEYTLMPVSERVDSAAELVGLRAG